VIRGDLGAGRTFKGIAVHDMDCTALQISIIISVTCRRVCVGDCIHGV
jgi:hypothetical protein